MVPDAHIDYMKLLEWGIPIAVVVFLGLIGVIWKMWTDSVGKLDNRLGEMDNHFETRQKNLISHFENITTAIATRQNATDDRITLIQQDFNNKYIEVIQRQSECKLEHRTSGVRRDDIQNVIDRITDLSNKHTALTAEFVKWKDSVIEHHAKFHNGGPK